MIFAHTQELQAASVVDGEFFYIVPPSSAPLSYLGVTFKSFLGVEGITSLPRDGSVVVIFDCTKAEDEAFLRLLRDENILFKQLVPKVVIDVEGVPYRDAKNQLNFGTFEQISVDVLVERAVARRSAKRDPAQDPGVKNMDDKDYRAEQQRGRRNSGLTAKPGVGAQWGSGDDREEDDFGGEE